MMACRSSLFMKAILFARRNLHIIGSIEFKTAVRKVVLSCLDTLT